MQGLDAKNPDNSEDNSSARTSRSDQPGRSQEIKKERYEKIDKTGKYFPKMGGGGGKKKKKKKKNFKKPFFN